MIDMHRLKCLMNTIRLRIFHFYLNVTNNYKFIELDVKH